MNVRVLCLIHIRNRIKVDCFPAFWFKIMWAAQLGLNLDVRLPKILSNKYRKFPKYSDTQKFVEIILKFELCGSTIE